LYFNDRLIQRLIITIIIDNLKDGIGRLRNIKSPKLCNRLQVKTLHTNIIEATVITGYARGEIVYIPKIPLILIDLFEFKRIQFPIKVCFAMTINKSQGQSLNMAGINLREDCFSHGQFYVGMLHVTELVLQVV